MEVLWSQIQILMIGEIVEAQALAQVLMVLWTGVFKGIPSPSLLLLVHIPLFSVC
jgi:hypothetical protein